MEKINKVTVLFNSRVNEKGEGREVEERGQKRKKEREERRKGGRRS